MDHDQTKTKTRSHWPVDIKYKGTTMLTKGTTVPTNTLGLGYLTSKTALSGRISDLYDMRI